MMKKQLLGGAILSALLGFALFVTTTVNAEPTAKNKTTKEATTRTLTIAADSSLTGRISPYMTTIPNTGKISLHYLGKGLGFSDFDNTTLFIQLPEEMASLASQPDFAKYVTGTINAPGQKAQTISLNNLTVYPDRLVISMGTRFFVGVGNYGADIQIDYGKLLAKYPNIPFENHKDGRGYLFSSRLVFDVAPWDIIKYPIIGTYSGELYTGSTNAIY